MPHNEAMPNQIVLRAAAAIGGQAELARLLNVTSPTVNQWAKGDRPVPVQHCQTIVRAAKGKVSLQDLRPDDWHLIWPELVKTKRVKAEQGAA